jgi:hypothetical protein
LTRRAKHLKNSENKEELQGITEISVPDAESKALSTNNIELINIQQKPASVRKKTSRGVKANSVALKTSRSKTTKLDGGAHVNPAPEQTNIGIGDTHNGNSNKKRGSFIPRLHLSYILIVLLLIFCAVPMIKMSYQVPVPYQAVETYTEQEPYVESVAYTEKEPYTTTQAYIVTQPYTVTVPYVVYPHPAPPPPTTNNMTPPNPTLPPQPQVYYRDVTKYMNITQYRDVTQYQDVQKSKNEMKVKPVQKQRTVTKIGMETRYKVVPILYYLISYEE